VKSLGASEAFDYNSPSCGADIRKATKDSLYYVWDAIGEGDSVNICSDAIASDTSGGPNGKGMYCNIVGAKLSRTDVVSKSTLMYTTFGEEFAKWGMTFPANKEDKEYMKRFVVASEPLIANGEVKPHKIDAREGGLDGILGGLKDMQEGKVSAAKLVYTVGSDQAE
jgi:hypothetical protein